MTAAIRGESPRRAKHRGPNVAVRNGNRKLLVNAEGAAPELYDLAADPGEAKDLAPGKPDVAMRLTEESLAWRNSPPCTSSS